MTALSSICDIAVCPVSPHAILVATEAGRVYLFADATTATGTIWDCHGGTALRVGWAERQPLAWNTDPVSHQLWVLRADGRVVQHSIPSHADVATSDDGFFIACNPVRLAYYELSNDGTVAKEKRDVPAPSSYDPGSLSASRSGAVAVSSGGHLQLQRAGRPWQNVQPAGPTFALSSSGNRLATSTFHVDGSYVHSLLVGDSETKLETQYAVRALPTRITDLQWSDDESMLLGYARAERDVRVFSRDQWDPGLWCTSAIRPRFHPAGVITVPDSRDLLVLQAFRGNPPKTWTRNVPNTPETFEISGNPEMRRGDMVVTFEKRPRVRPTAIYEVVDAPRKDDDTRGAPTRPVTCRLRLGLSSLPDEALDAEAAPLSALASNIGGEVDRVDVRGLLERLFVAFPTDTQHLRMHLALPSGQAVTQTASSVATGAHLPTQPPAVPITQQDMRVIEEVLQMRSGRRGPGYVLDFSDDTFAKFFTEELGIDIDDTRYKTNGASKAKRLRSLLAESPGPVRARILNKLLERRLLVDDQIKPAVLAYYRALVERGTDAGTDARARLPDGQPVYADSVMRDLHLSDAVSDAIEASYYLVPDAPGLSQEELVAALGDVGFKAGEIADAVKTGTRSGLGWGRSGLQFTASELPLYLGPHLERFVGDPRDWETFAFVQELLQGLAKEKGLANAKLGISEVVLEGQNRGFDRLHLLQAIYGLQLMMHAKIDVGSNTIALTQQGAGWALLNQPRALPPVERQHFAKILAAVRREITRRDPEVRWRELRDALASIKDPSTLSADEEGVLDEICAHFADTGEPSSIDDMLRKLPDEVDVRFIANTNLQDKRLVHAQPDTRMIPSLRALRRRADLFSRFFLLATDVLKRSKELWDAKELNVALVGVRGLVQPPRPGSPTPVEMKQLQLLVDSLSFAPCLAPQSPGKVELRDDLRTISTVVQLLEHQLRPIPTAQPGARVESPNESRDKPMSKQRLRMFIGSTVETLPIAREIQTELDHDFHITLWNQNVFQPGQATWTDLVNNARGGRFDLALLVLGGEDEVTSRGITSSAPRDNVLLEFGLFTGALGSDRTFFLIDRDHKPKIATDLAGITPLTYSGDRVREDKNLQAAVGAACNHLRKIADKIAKGD